MIDDATLIERARNTAIERVVEARGIKLRGRVERVGPCPVCGGVDRFSINTKKRCFNCRGYGGGDVIALIQHLDNCNFAEAVETLAGHRTTLEKSRAANAESHRRARKLPGRPGGTQSHADLDDVARSRELARWLWCKSKVPGPIIERYLREARGYRGLIPATLRYLPPSEKYPEPAMISAFGFASEPQPGLLAITEADITGVHLTKLKLDGSGKADIEENKTTIGKENKAPIILAPVNDLLGLAITEGIEDGLAAFQATGLGVWAAGNAGRMPALAATVPDYVEAVTVYSHADQAGQHGAVALAEALSRRGGIEVLIEGVQ
jgi:putative DNA primase/helicase